MGDSSQGSDDDRLERWLVELCAELGVPLEVAGHRQLLLDVARDAAHQVVRPAAPLTTFLVGYAAGLAAGRNETPETAVARAAAVATRLADRQERSARA